MAEECRSTATAALTWVSLRRGSRTARASSRTEMAGATKANSEQAILRAWACIRMQTGSSGRASGAPGGEECHFFENRAAPPTAARLLPELRGLLVRLVGALWLLCAPRKAQRGAARLARLPALLLLLLLSGRATAFCVQRSNATCAGEKRGFNLICLR